MRLTYAFLPSYQRNTFPIERERESMSETMSSPGDWAQFYHQNVSGSNQMVPQTRLSSGIDPVSEPITVTSTITSTIGSSAPSSSNLGNLSPEGRVSKPVRRRSRASRRTPTTLLNTDTTNFRAMVQQFTGGPSAPFASGPHPGAGAAAFGFGLGGSGGARAQAHVNPGTVMMHPGYRLQYQVQQQQQFQQQNQGGYMISLGNNNPPGPGGDSFFQRLGSNPGRPNMEVSDGFVMENINVSSHSQVALGAPRPPNSNENRGNTFLF